MKICTFFGHRDAPYEILSELKKVITELIINENITHFLLGNDGNFDVLARKTLGEIKKDFPQIKYEVVLAYLPKKQAWKNELDLPTVYPEGLESVPPRFAISKRNEWLVKQADIVVTYVRKTYGGASKYEELAIKKGKRIIKI